MKTLLTIIACALLAGCINSHVQVSVNALTSRSQTATGAGTAEGLSEGGGETAAKLK